MIRSVKKEDAERLIEIYAPCIINSPISFETEVPSLDEFQKRIEEVTSKFPWLVLEENGVVLGYAYASTHRIRSAYAWSVECTVYVDQKFHGKGIGTKLYKELFRLLKDQGVANVLAGITIPNIGSVKIHESLGFEQVATYKDIGFKNGQWWDVGWWQLQLQKVKTPSAILPPKKIP
ncbi:MAG: arsinothricin resistance N-acetyltransferase ArsN1 family B [Bacteriovoracaceae bacterium]